MTEDATTEETLKKLRRALAKIPAVGSHFEEGPRVPVIRLSGVIADNQNRRQGISYARYAKLIEKIFKKRGISAVALCINSPGGMAGQTSLLAGLIRRLAEEKEIPVYAFVEDVAASGGYWLACAADEIYAQDVSIVGSIGVITGSFGFDEFIEKHGIKRRLYTAGREKSMLDPFLPEKPEDVERLAVLHKDMHRVFIDWVRERRGQMLKATDKTLFEGRVWTGQPALELGLIDGLGDVHGIMREKFGEKVKLLNVPDGSFFSIPLLGKRLNKSAFSENIAEDLIAAVEDRALWGRFGL